MTFQCIEVTCLGSPAVPLSLRGDTAIRLQRPISGLSPRLSLRFPDPSTERLGWSREEMGMKRSYFRTRRIPPAQKAVGVMGVRRPKCAFVSSFHRRSSSQTSSAATSTSATSSPFLAEPDRHPPRCWLPCTRCVALCWLQSMGEHVWVCRRRYERFGDAHDDSIRISNGRLDR